MSEAPEKKNRNGRVVYVTSPFELVINVGASGGAKNGEQVLIYGEGVEIFDIEDNHSLGKLEIVKGRGQIVHVQEKISTVKSTEKRRREGKKTIRRGNDITRAVLGLSGQSSTEEVVDGPEYIDEPFKDVEVGDFFKFT